MRRFPTTESSVSQLASQMITGIRENPEYFNELDPEVIANDLAAYNLVHTQQALAAAAARTATTKKRSALNNLTLTLQAQLKKAEAICIKEPDRLSYIGWRSLRQTKVPASNPGFELEARRQPDSCEAMRLS